MYGLASSSSSRRANRVAIGLLAAVLATGLVALPGLVDESVNGASPSMTKDSADTKARPVGRQARCVAQ